MVKLRFVVRNGALFLRISEGKERFYRTVNSVLVGNPNIEKHWDNAKEKFTRVAVRFKENNDALAAFKAEYQKFLLNNPDADARSVSKMSKSVSEVKTSENVPADAPLPSDTLEAFMEKLIVREQAKSGCNFETYQKLLKKMRKIVPNFSRLTLQELDFDKCVWLAGVFARHPGYFCSMRVFRNTLGKASKDPDAPFKMAQVGDFNFRDYDPDKDVVKDHKPDVLTHEQIRQFMELDLTATYARGTSRWSAQLYHDFCVFMLHSMMAPCDVLKLKKRDISRAHTIVTRRKKTHCAVEVPISPVMDAIMSRYSGKSKDGYIFPIMDDKKEAEYTVRDYTLKLFREKLNVWLKKAGKQMGLGYSLYAYVFRHTAITLALDGGLPISYVASVAGTSIEMIQKHYYNADNKQNSMKLQLALLKASGCA